MVNYRTYFDEKWEISSGTLVGQPATLLNVLISTQPSLFDQTYENNFHGIRTEYTGQNALVGIFTDTPIRDANGKSYNMPNYMW